MRMPTAFARSALPTLSSCYTRISLALCRLSFDLQRFRSIKIRLSHRLILYNVRYSLGFLVREEIDLLIYAQRAVFPRDSIVGLVAPELVVMSSHVQDLQYGSFRETFVAGVNHRNQAAFEDRIVKFMESVFRIVRLL